MENIRVGLARLGVDARPRKGGDAVPIVAVSPYWKVVRCLRWPLRAIRSLAGDELRDQGLALVAACPELFGGPDIRAVDMVATDGDPGGGLSVALRQCHGPRRIRVSGGVRFHVRRDRMIDTIDNQLFVDLDRVPTEPRITEAEAVARARDALADASPPIATQRAAAAPADLLVVSHERRPYLAWRVWLRGVRKASGRLFVARIDAETGALIDWYDNTQAALGTGTGHYAGSGLRLQTSSVGAGKFELRDVSRAPVTILTLDGDDGPVSSTSNNDWRTPVRRHAEADAHHFAGVVADYFRQRGQRHRRLGDRGTIRIHVHSKIARGAGFGKWDSAAKVVRLSDGDGEAWKHCSSLDWVAHELVHSYTQATCDLLYRDQSGALNDAISDIFTAFITGEWGRFKESWRGSGSRTPKPYRNMGNPHNGKQWNSLPDKARAS